MTIRQWTLSSINQLVKQFEQGALSKEEWTHHAHLVVCSYYLYHYNYQEATLRIKLGIIRFNDAVGTENTIDGGYHETLTLFWIWAVNAYITDQSATLEELVNGLLNSPYSK